MTKIAVLFKKKKREREKRRIKVAGKMLSPILDMFEVIPHHIREHFRTVLDSELRLQVKNAVDP